MAILWCGGEDIDFAVRIGPAWGGTKAGLFRSGYARSYATLPAGTGQPVAKSPAFPGGAVTSCWFSFRLIASSVGTNSLGPGLGDSSTSKSGLFVGNSSTGANIALCKYDGATRTELAAETGGSLNTSMHKIDMQIINYGASATVNVYCDGNLVITYSGDVTVAGVTDLDCVMLGWISRYSSWHVSELIVADTDTRNLSLVTHAPNAAGDTLDWTGAYTTVDELVIDDADLAYDNTDGHQAMYNLSATPAGTFSVVCVKEIVRACRASDSAPTSLDIGIKSNSNVDVDDNHALSTFWAEYSRYLATNPCNGGAAFTTADLDALQIVLESEA